MRYNHLTGKPVSEEMEEVLSRLNRNEEVSLDEIKALPEMREAYEYESSIKPIEMSKEMKDEIKNGIIRNILGIGSVVIDESGKKLYNGDVGKDKRLDLVIGLPASGKSSNIAIPLSQQYNARIIDSDMVKEQLPGFENGWGANYVHEDSKDITDDIIKEALSQGDNIVHPIVGSHVEKVKELMKFAQEYGYSVNIHYAEIEPNRALGRMLNRFIEEGRFLRPDLRFKYQDKVRETYEQLKGEYDYEHGKHESTGRSQSEGVGYVREVLLRRDNGCRSGGVSVFQKTDKTELPRRTIENDRRGEMEFRVREDGRTERSQLERISGRISLGISNVSLFGREEYNDSKSAGRDELGKGNIQERTGSYAEGAAIPLPGGKDERNERYAETLVEYSKWNMDVPRGEHPILCETNCHGQLFRDAILRQLDSKDYHIHFENGNNILERETDCPYATSGYFNEYPDVRPFIKEVKETGYQLTPKMEAAYANIALMGSKSVSMRDISILYRNQELLKGEALDNIKEIGDECKRQEVLTKSSEREV